MILPQLLTWLGRGTQSVLCICCQ